MKTKAHILLVDDEIDMLNLSGGMLRSAGYKVTQAHSAKEALSHILEEKDQFNLLITDFIMTEMSGLSLIKTLHEMNITIPFFVVSGFVNKLVLDILREKGCKAFLQKPLNKDHLLETVILTLDEKAMINNDMKVFEF